MFRSKALVLLLGAASGVAIGATVIGLLLVGTATVIDLQADAASVLTQHPLFVSGSKLVTRSFLLALPLFLIWSVWAKGVAVASESRPASDS